MRGHVIERAVQAARRLSAAVLACLVVAPAALAVPGGDYADGGVVRERRLP